MKYCIVCNIRLTGKQKLYCSKSCRNKNYYDNTIKASPEKQYQAHIRLNTIFANARKRGLELPTLTKQKLIELLDNKRCHYCDRDCEPTVDRKDSGITYTNDNAVQSCRTCNRIKSSNVSYSKMIKIGEIIKE